MTPGVAARLGLTGTPAPQRRGEPDPGLMARALMYLFLAGALITLGSLLLPGAAEEADRARLVVTASAGLGVSLFLFAAYDRVPRWAFPLLLACGTLLIEWTIYASGETTSPYAMFYVWLAIYAFYFLPRWQAYCQLAFIALAYAAILTLAEEPGSSPVVRWAVTTSALIVAGAMIGLLKERVDRLMTQISDLTRTDVASGLLNRRAFIENLERAIELARRTRVRVTLAIGELEPGEDETIEDEQRAARVGTAFAGGLRGSDAAARLGSRSFAVIAPGTGDHGGFVMAERLREMLTAALDEPEATMSFGVATFPDHADTGEELVAAAQEALAEARALGRGRVVTSGASREAATV